MESKKGKKVAYGQIQGRTARERDEFLEEQARPKAKPMTTTTAELRKWKSANYGADRYLTPDGECYHREGCEALDGCREIIGRRPCLKCRSNCVRGDATSTRVTT